MTQQKLNEFIEREADAYADKNNKYSSSGVSEYLAFKEGAALLLPMRRRDELLLL
jgi:hypothetical protein